MNALMLSRMLGWFSLALGAMEIALPGTLSRKLGLPGGSWLVRAFGAREVAAGLIVLSEPSHAFGPSSRVAGDVLDIATLAPALSRDNPHRVAAHVALAMVLGVTALDILCASTLISDDRRRHRTARETRVTIPGRATAA